MNISNKRKRKDKSIKLKGTSFKVSINEDWFKQLKDEELKVVMFGEYLKNNNLNGILNQITNER